MTSPLTADGISLKIDQLPPEKRALLQQWLKTKQPPRRQSIPRRQIPGDCPLSFAQQRLWLFTQLEPENPAYHNIITLRLTGPVNGQALQRALSTIIERHEALRTQFWVIQGQPVQHIAQRWCFELSQTDVSQQSQPEQFLKSLLQQHACQPFDLTRDLMLRACLIHLNKQEHVLQMVMHHIVSDGRSMQVLSQELQVLYGVFCHALGDNQQPPVLPPLLLQYADFALWERQRLTPQKTEHHLRYWQQHLANSPPLLEIPGDYPRPAKSSYRGALHPFVLSQPLVEGLKHLSRQTEATLFMTLLAAFKVFLYRYTQQTDIVVGSPMSNRSQEQLKDLIGFFTNTVVLRTDLSGSPSFCDLLGRVKAMAIEAYDHQDLPFEKLVEALQPDRDSSYGQIFQVLFVMQPEPLTGIGLEGLHSRVEQMDTGTTKLDLTLSIFESADTLTGLFEYSTDLFDAATVERMAAQYEVLLAGIVDNPDQAIARLPILSAAEQDLLLGECQLPQLDRSDDGIHHRFEQQVRRTPQGIALQQGTEQLTYAVLNATANQLAHRLLSLGIGPGSLVVVCMERSWAGIVAILAILKAGGAYVPIDPTYPAERIAYILGDCHAGLVLTQPHLAASLPATDTQVICLDQTCFNQDYLHQDPPETWNNPVTAVTPHNLAYVIYTSGSTGRPKGVMVEHGALVNYIDAAAACYGIEGCDRILQFASIGFDIAVEEIFTALTTGSTLVLRNEAMIASARLFLATCQAWQITVLDLPTAYWHQLVDDITRHQLKIPPCLRTVVIGGERVLLKKVQQWYQGQAPQLINTYGPTETTVAATVYPCTPDAIAGLAHVPIGRPYDNVQVYVLDTALQPVPIGVPGELHIGGAGLARGYLNQPARTAERFIPAPWNPNIRLYKTGDLVKYRPDGDLEFLGRLDHQVKLRGFRIELGEIETTLGQHPTVREAIVCMQDRGGQPHLAAYVVPHKQQAVTPQELRTFVQKTLPSYMVPASFTAVAHWPLTPNGKIDLCALPQPSLADRATTPDYAAPRTPTEQKLASLWRDVLAIERVGIYDNFFALGGHSLLATQVVSRIQQLLQVDVTLRQLFETPTVAALGEQLDTLIWAQSAPALETNRQEGEL